MNEQQRRLREALANNQQASKGWDASAKLLLWSANATLAIGVIVVAVFVLACIGFGLLLL